VFNVVQDCTLFTASAAIVDASSLWEATTDISREYNLSFDHSFSWEHLAGLVEEAMGTDGTDADFYHKLAFFAVNPGNNKQMKFAESLGCWDTKLVDYRDTYCLSPVKRASSAQPSPSPSKTLAPTISFALGALYGTNPKGMDVFVITGDHLIYPALAKFASNEANRVRLGFFGSRLDSRWERSRKFNKSGKPHRGAINFVDFENDPAVQARLFNGARFSPPKEGDPFDFI